MNVLASDRRSPLGILPGQPTPRLYDCVVEALRSRHYSRRTEEAYLHWIRRFLAFHGGTHPRELAGSDVNPFLTHLAISENVAASTQNQALAAVLFLYQHASWNSPWIESKGWCGRKPKRLPVVLTQFHDARKTIDPATFVVVDDIRQKFRIRDDLLEIGERGVLDDPEYRRYQGERDDFLGVVEATFDRIEVYEALKYFMLAHAEDRATLYATEAGVVDRLNQKLSTLGVLSLARRSDCPVMWSHYAANHTGVVLVFETERDPMLSKARALAYVESRPTMTVANVVDVLYMKAAAWLYEAEYRVLEKNGNQCYGFNEEALVGVIFGMRMSQRALRQVSVAIKQRMQPVLLCEAWSDAANYSICTRPVDGPDHHTRSALTRRCSRRAGYKTHVQGRRNDLARLAAERRSLCGQIRFGEVASDQEDLMDCDTGCSTGRGNRHLTMDHVSDDGHRADASLL